MAFTRLCSALLLLLHAATGSKALAAEPPMFDAPALSDAQLADARGGFTLPNGMNINFGVVITTRVDGVPLLKTEFQIAGDSASASVSTGALATAGKTTAGAGNGGATASAGGANAVSGTADGGSASANAGGVSASADNSGAISGTIGDNSLSLSREGGVEIKIGGLSVSTSREGQVQVDLGAGGASVTTTDATTAIGGMTVTTTQDATADTPVATVSIGSTGLSTSVEMQDLLIQHDIGSRLAAIVVNSGDNRVIDSQLTINMQLSDVEPMALGSAGLRVEALGVDAAIWRSTGG